jgi:hypothetical protein
MERLSGGLSDYPEDRATISEDGATISEDGATISED